VYIFGGRAEVGGLFGTLKQNEASREILTNETWILGFYSKFNNILILGYRT
jgi:hypothetical protein